jgi:hypothetical protein
MAQTLHTAYPFLYVGLSLLRKSNTEEVFLLINYLKYGE